MAMSYREFREELLNQLRSIFGENYEIGTQTVQKVNLGNVETFRIFDKTGEKQQSPVFYGRKLYEAYKRGTGLEVLAQDMKEKYEMTGNEITVNLIGDVNVLEEINVNGDPYEYTKFFFSKQDIFTSITERSYARNKVLLLVALKELRKYPDLTREEIRAFLAKLNQAGAITVFDFLNQAQAKTLCESVMEEIKSVPRLTEGSIFCAVNNITGKKYGSNMTIKDGKILMAGKAMITKPKNLIGKKEGSKFIISGKEYVITEVKSTS